MRKLFLFICILIEIYSSSNLRKLQKSDDIIILHTNDVHCGVKDSIGYDGLALLKKQLQKKYNYVFTVDIGDHIQGDTLGILTQGEGIIKIMNKLSYDVAILGNHEFDYKIDVLKSLSEKINCGYISTNYCYKKNKTAIFDEYVIKEAGDKKIAFIGMTTPEALTKSYLLTLVDDQGNLIYDFLSGNNNQDLYDKVQKNIDEVRAKGADYVILLAHFGMEGDVLEENTSKRLLSHLTGVDALLDGHTHQVYNKTTPDKNKKEVIIAQTGTKLKNIGKLIIKADGTLSHEMISKVELDNDYDKSLVETVTRSGVERHVDKETREFIDSLFNDLSDKLEEIIGYSPFDLKINKDPSDDSHEQLTRNEENNLANLVSDAIRSAASTDVVILNAGTIKKDLFEGNITYKDILNILPYSDDIIVKIVSGQTILDALEHGVRLLPQKSARFPQVSGLKYKIDMSINSSVVVDANVFVKVDGERRVYDVYVGNEKLDPQKNYSISSRGFLLGGGDGYSMFTSYDVAQNSIKIENQALSDFIKIDLKGVIPEKYKEVEGRIIKTEGKQLNEDKENNSKSKGNYIKRTKFLFVFIILAIIL